MLRTGLRPDWSRRKVASYFLGWSVIFSHIIFEPRFNDYCGVTLYRWQQLELQIVNDSENYWDMIIWKGTQRWKKVAAKDPSSTAKRWQHMKHAATDIIKKTMDSENLYESNYMFLLTTRDYSWYVLNPILFRFSLRSFYTWREAVVVLFLSRMAMDPFVYVSLLWLLSDRKSVV